MNMNVEKIITLATYLLSFKDARIYFYEILIISIFERNDPKTNPRVLS